LENGAATAAIRGLLERNAPGMIARFGSAEVKALLWPHLPWAVKRAVERRVISDITVNAGFFPAAHSAIGRFSALMYDDMSQLDVLGSWRPEEYLLYRQLRHVTRVKLASLEPYLSADPWSKTLEGKRVLVVHPFSRTIENQYHNHRHRLFADTRVLPEFGSLATIQAVQTIAGNRSQYEDWFQALDSMKAAMDAVDYDVAIIGCGAYGFPLAAHAKRRGRLAVHLGGATQILFGIRGRRWDENPRISRLYNEWWVRPAPEERAPGVDRVENACYW
jgi:glycine/D-amino acid oxidase-like deaminating enzyme